MNLELTLRYCLSQSKLHACWLNTLAYLENVGAKKIMRAEVPSITNLSMLKHAAEETRHAFFLKSQIERLGFSYYPTFTRDEILAPMATQQYIRKLDVQVSRYLKSELGYFGPKLKRGAYFLVTYAIEVRAKMVYPLYEEILREMESPISVRNIIAEEDQHLEEMAEAMRSTLGARWKRHADFACDKESQLFHHWQATLTQKIMGNANRIQV